MLFPVFFVAFVLNSLAAYGTCLMYVYPDRPRWWHVVACVQVSAVVAAVWAFVLIFNRGFD